MRIYEIEQSLGEKNTPQGNDLIEIDEGPSGQSRYTSLMRLGNAIGLGSLGRQDAAAAALTGGEINGTKIGTTTATEGHFTTVNVHDFLHAGSLPAPQTSRLSVCAGGNLSAFQALNGANEEMLRIINSTTAGTENPSYAIMYIKHNHATGRSLNITGTINASGADFAEYEIKRTDCGDIAKGDIVGFDTEGYLTDRWDLALGFGVKSTNPSFVGGDNWNSQNISEQIETNPNFDDQKLQDARTRIDRIAYCGKVPLNHYDQTFTAGQAVIATPTETGGICPTFKPISDLTVEDRSYLVGRVRCTGADGRPIIVVQP